MKDGRNCYTCGAYLGGGACRNNLELECAAGEGFECWEPRTIFSGIDLAEAYVREIGHQGGWRVHKERGHYVLTLDGGTE